MGASNAEKGRRTLVIAGLALWAGGCADTGFGQPCNLPETESFRQWCEPAPAENDDDAIQRESKASCAVRDFAGCETRTCLVYRDSNPFCSEPCTSDGDCESEICAPLIGDRPPGDELQRKCEQTDCYCIRKGDLDN